MEKILIIDDERSMREFLELLLKQEGYKTVCCANVTEAKKLISTEHFDLLVTDLKLPDGNGLELLTEAKEHDPDTEVVVITAFGTTQTAVEAMKLGAYDYIVKPFKIDHIQLIVRKALEKGALARENRELKRTIEATTSSGGILSQSPRMHEMIKLIERVAPTGVTVLIQGDSGTGKELVAQRLHKMSGRKGRFVPVNCSAIPEGLVESELFGHVKGSFTGASVDKAGLFEEAQGGSIFLDEVTELPLLLQPKLLRALQQLKIKRVGGVREIDLDVLIISATNKDIAKEVRENRFREDLYYRLNVVVVQLPPLKERREDIALLATHFLEKYRRSFGRDIKGFSPQVLKCLEAHDYPGNVRELENIIERAVALETSEELTIQSLPEHVRRNTSSPTSRSEDLTAQGIDLDEVLKNTELGYINRAMELCDGNKTRAAKLLGMSFRSFRYRLDKLEGAEDADEG
jgi:two-component system response regulator PilR (NtrC family)